MRGSRRSAPTRVLVLVGALALLTAPVLASTPTAAAPGDTATGEATAGTGTDAARVPGLVDHLRRVGQRLEFVLRASDLLDGEVIEGGSVTVLASDGATRARLAAQAVPLSGETPGSATTSSVVIALDVSRSLLAEDFRREKTAAVALVEKLPRSTRIGLVEIGSQARVVVGPTTDHDRVTAAIRDLDQQENTALYDAVAAAAGALGTEGVRTVVLMTDGRNETDEDPASIDRTTAIRILERQRISLYAVAFGAKADRTTLGLLTRAGGGRVIEVADPAQLGTAFGTVGRTIGTQLLVHAEIPADLPTRLRGTQINLLVTATLRRTAAGTAGARTLTASAHTVLPTVSATEAAAAPLTPFTPPPPRFDITPQILAVALGLLFLGVIVPTGFALGRMTRGSRPEAQITRRLSSYTLTGTAPKKVRVEEQVATGLGDNALTRSAVDLADRVVQGRGLEAKLSSRLEGASVPLRPAEWLLIHAGSTVVTGLLLVLLSGGSAAGLLLGLLLGGAAPWIPARGASGRSGRSWPRCRTPSRCWPAGCGPVLAAAGPRRAGPGDPAADQHRGEPPRREPARDAGGGRARRGRRRMDSRTSPGW